MGILEAATQRMKMEEARYEEQIAALKAENERLAAALDDADMVKREAIAGWKDAERALAERAAVKVKALEAAKIARLAATEMIAQKQQWHLDPAYIVTLCDEIDRLSALTTEPAAPEGFCYRDENGQVQYQQMAPEGRQDDDRIRREMDEILRKQSERDIPFVPSTRPSEQAVTADWQRVDDALVSCAGLLRMLCRDEIGETAASELEYVRSVIGRRSEQAVTEAMAEAACLKWFGDTWRVGMAPKSRAQMLADMSNALKAAMEAGR